MRKPWVIAAILAVVFIAGVLVSHHKRQAEAPDTVVFDLRYRGLTGLDDKLNYRRAWGFQSHTETGEDRPFVQAVRRQVPESDLVYNRESRNAAWSVVELQDKKAVALYFDLDANGALSDNERILPTPLPPQIGDIDTQFVTPDFMIRQENGREIPFRVVVLRWSGRDYLWTPGCILEGEATFAGKPMRLLLYGDRLTGSFTTFGRCSFTLIPAGQEPELSFPLPVLSSLICHEGAFYRLQFDGVHEKGRTLHLTITKDTSPIGRAAIHLNAREPLKIRPETVTITGAKDTSIQFSLPHGQSPLPVDDYRLSAGRILYGIETDDQWQMNFTEGPGFTVRQDQTADINLGEPTLGIKAIAEDEIGKGSIREKPVYAGGTLVYLSRLIRGKAGEVYGKFSRKGAADDQWTDIKPHIAIFDPEGNEVASGDMGYG